MAIIDFFDRGWRGNPTLHAYVQDERTFSFAEVGELSCRIAHALLAAGFGRGAKGAVWAGNDVDRLDLHAGSVARQHGVDSGQCAQRRRREPGLVLDAFDCEAVFYPASLRTGD